MAGVMFQGNNNVAKAENPADLFNRWLKPTGIHALGTHTTLNAVGFNRLILVEAISNMGKMQLSEINRTNGEYLLPSVSTDGFEAESRSWPHIFLK